MQLAVDEDDTDGCPPVAPRAAGLYHIRAAGLYHIRAGGSFNAPQGHTRKPHTSTAPLPCTFSMPLQATSVVPSHAPLLPTLVHQAPPVCPRTASTSSAPSYIEHLYCPTSYTEHLQCALILPQSHSLLCLLLPPGARSVKSNLIKVFFGC